MLCFCSAAFQLAGDRSVGEAKDLEAPRVGDDRKAPLDKFVEASRLADDTGAGLEHEVVGVAKHELQADLFDGDVVERLEGAVRADRDEVWGY